MDKKTIIDGENVYCLSSSEAKMLYEHINGYLNTEVVINENDIIIDIKKILEFLELNFQSYLIIKLQFCHLNQSKTFIMF